MPATPPESLDDTSRFIRYQFSPEFLDIKTIGTNLEFTIGEPRVGLCRALPPTPRQQKERDLLLRDTGEMDNETGPQSGVTRINSLLQRSISRALHPPCPARSGECRLSSRSPLGAGLCASLPASLRSDTRLRRAAAGQSSLSSSLYRKLRQSSSLAAEPDKREREHAVLDCTAS